MYIFFLNLEITESRNWYSQIENGKKENIATHTNYMEEGFHLSRYIQVSMAEMKTISLHHQHLISNHLFIQSYIQLQYIYIYSNTHA